jgi:hypothetical protein
MTTRDTLAEANPPLPDGFSRETCYVVACASCGYKFDEEEFTTVHFGSVTEATDEVRSVGWTVLTDGRVLCQVPDEDHSALRLLAEPDPDNEPDDAPTTADLFTGDELQEMERDAEFAMDAADDEANTAAVEAEEDDQR